MRILNYLLVPTLLVSCLLAACSSFSSGLSSNQQSAADNALKSLRKISAAIDVRVSYLQYGPMVIDAKAAVNEASALLPDGELKREMNAAMDAYADACVVWTDEVDMRLSSSSSYEYTGGPWIFTNIQPGKTLIPKYGLVARDGQVECGQAINAIWLIGRKHLDNATAAFNK